MLMESKHLSRHRLDDEISQRALDTFIKELDPLKLFFYQSDVDEFMTQQNQLDDQIKRGDIRFAYDVFARFLPRVDERVNTALAMLDQPHDFSIDEEMIRDADAATFAKTPEEAEERWRQRVKFDLLEGNGRRRRDGRGRSRSSASATTASARAGSKPTTTSCSSAISRR